MQIQHLAVSGFRNLSPSTIEYGQSNIQSIIGINNFGKSNLLAAFSFAARFMRADPNEKRMLMRDAQYIPVNRALENEPFSFAVEYISYAGKKETVVQYAFSFKWAKAADGNIIDGEIISEDLKMKARIKHGRYGSYIQREGLECAYLASPKARCSTPLTVNEYLLGINELMKNDKIFFYDLLAELNDFRSRVIPAGDGEIAFGRPGNVFTTPDPFHFSLKNRAEAARFVHFLKENKPDEYDLFVQSVKELIPDVQSITPAVYDIGAEGGEGSSWPLDERYFELWIKQKQNFRAASPDILSGGTRRIMYLLLSAVLANVQKIPLLAIEEFEQSIHPSLVKRLLIMFEALAPQCRILISTQSPLFIDYLSLNNVYLGIPSAERTAQFKRMKQSKINQFAKMAQEQKKSAGEFLFELMLGGAIEQELIEEFFEGKRGPDDGDDVIFIPGEEDEEVSV